MHGPLGLACRKAATRRMMAFDTLISAGTGAAALRLGYIGKQDVRINQQLPAHGKVWAWRCFFRVDVYRSSSTLSASLHPWLSSAPALEFHKPLHLKFLHPKRRNPHQSQPLNLLHPTPSNLFARHPSLQSPPENPRSQPGNGPGMTCFVYALAASTR